MGSGSPTRQASPPASGSSKSSSQSRSAAPISRSVRAGQRAERRVADRHQGVGELLGVEVDRPAHPLLRDVVQQLGAQVASVLGGRRVGVLEHGVHERAEGRAHRAGRPSAREAGTVGGRLDRRGISGSSVFGTASGSLPNASPRAAAVSASAADESPV